ncbi:MAG TPA: zinc ribbon domain-containing protein [Blastocatellia bacterium]|nr:zinc ribbon domain-containing protein [Blastocatellia bacterium]
MYCPKCGLYNSDDLKFCTRCGTNLGAVSEALTGGFERETGIDERLVELLKNYYRGRRMTTLGFFLSALMIFKLTLMMVLGMPEKFLLLVPLLGILLAFGMVWFIWGATKWNNSSSELKALGYDDPRNASPRRKRQIDGLPEGSTVMTVKRYTTDSLKEEAPPPPPSVTENTTKFLEEEKPPAPLPRRVPQ